MSAVGVLLVLALAACTDDSGLTGRQKQAISSFRAGGNSICATATTSLRAAVVQANSQFTTTPSSDDAKSFLISTFIPIVEKEIGDLHNLGEPTRDRVAWDDIRSKLDKALSDLKTNTDKNPVATYKTAIDKPTGGGSAALDKQLSDFGITECAKR